ncbi:glucosamine 6-phosphate synthetase [Solibacillus silvestris StLB046]|uniref:Glucosamine 6-phosphate synthetase n=1 Tax=Solibacillus silvestris (strain StLB046) TaxID=1002809 RepID=F2F2M4_SOLSS|nr:putative phage tail protein [Solibacillus silvestris]BAK15862.1 glucosamine 6-phosphate synthetase [Solibacillus silvestris StLB046]
MHAIPNPTWEGVISYTWADLNLHQWECFRTALFETITEQAVVGVKIDASNAEMIVFTEMQPIGVLILQSPVIMQTQSEMITNIVVSEVDYFSDMLKRLPLYERKSSTIREVIKSYDREFRNTEQQLEVVERNQLIDTAIESLPIFERDLGIRNRASLNYQQRREQIISRNIANFSQTTEEVIKQVASAYSNGEVDINKTNVPGIYEIKFIGTKGIPDNIEGLKESIEIVAPGHLQFDYAFSFNAWEFLRNRKWGEVSSMTWNDLQIWNEVS